MCTKNVGSILRKNYNLEEILRKPINYDISFLNSAPLKYVSIRAL